MFRRGQILLAILPVFALAVGATVVLITAGQFTFRVEETSRLERDAAAIADAGIARAMACLQATDTSTCGGRVGVNYTGENGIAVGNGTVTITITTIDAQRRRVRAAAAIPDETRARATAARSAELRIDVSPIGFAYGAQAGDGGVSMGNNSTIDGSLYSNGWVNGGNGVRITGDAFVAGPSVLPPAIDVSVTPTTFTFGAESPNIDIGQRFVAPTSGYVRSVALFLGKTGSPPNAGIRITAHDAGRDAPSTTTLAQVTLTAAQVGTTPAWMTIPFTNPAAVTAGTTYWIVIDATRNDATSWSSGFDTATPSGKASADFASRVWQSANGTFAHRIWIGSLDTGIYRVNVTRDVRAHTVNWVTASRSVWATDMYGSTVGGTVQSGTITYSVIGGNAYGKTISSATIGRNVWCETITNSTVGGRRYCPTAVTVPTDLAPAPFPITTDQIAAWKSDAASGGTTGTLNPTSGTITRVGPVRIEGDLVLDNNQTLIVTGTIHVTGRMNIGQNGSVILDSAYGGNSGMIIVDGTINLANNGTMRGSGTSGSYLLLISFSDQSSDTDPAIDIHNSANGAMFYAPNGSARLHNTTTISQLTAKKIRMDNGAVLRYERGFLDARFTSGPTAGWTPVLGTWRRE